jgi:hypothetical protein
MTAWLERIRAGLLRAADPRRVPGVGITAHALFLMPDGVYTIAGDPACDPVLARRWGGLERYLERVLPPWQLRARASRDLVGEAWGLAERVRELRFVLNELLPFLRSLDGTAGGAPPPPTEALRSVQTQATELRGLLASRLALPSEPGILAGWLGVPCAVLGRQVVPLEPVAFGGTDGGTVTIGGELYRLRPEHARPSGEVHTRVQREQALAVRRALRRDRRLRALARTLSREVASLLAAHRLGSARAWEIFHRGHLHELQHHRGHWMLVRGPVEDRRAPGHSSFVGLAIRGGRREEWLAVPPTRAQSRRELWKRGAPVLGGLCMGPGRQYATLHSPLLDDADAVVQWLDAGVILVTGRSDLHRSLRERARAEASPDRIDPHQIVCEALALEPEIERFELAAPRTPEAGTLPPPGVRLSFSARALERCFLAADVLRDEFGQPRMEYALLGLSAARRPFHVLATPLLCGQHATPSTVVQRGRDVLRMRAEIERLSRRCGRRLRPVVFIHRHNGSCEASQTDRDFLRGVFVDQLSTLSPHAVAFSLIVNEARQHRLYAVRRVWGADGRPALADVVARLAASPSLPLGAGARAELRAELAAEIRARLSFGADEAEVSAS